MAVTLTFDKILTGRVLITREPGEDAVAFAEYVVVDTNGRVRLKDGGLRLTLTPTMQNQLNAFTVEALNQVKAYEGIP